MRYKRFAALAAVVVPTVGLMFASVPSAMAATLGPTIRDCSGSASLEGCTWGANASNGDNVSASLSVINGSGKTVSTEARVLSNDVNLWHAVMDVQQCDPPGKVATCKVIAANGKNTLAGGALFGVAVLQTSPKPVSFGHVYRACGSFEDESNGWKVVNVCTPFVAN